MAHPQRAALRRVIEQVGISTEQSVAIVIEVARHLHEWSTLGRPHDMLVPGVRDLRLERGGGVSWHTGHTLPARAVIPALGALLTALLRQKGARNSVPAGLMYLLVRSTHDPSLAPFVGLEEVIAALGRYAPLSTAAALDSLLAAYTISRAGLPPIDSASTVSDLRRLRRAGGVALATISTDTGIPLSLLRELEWGVYLNWPEAHADASIRAYASRAGLDPELTLEVISRERAMSAHVLAAARPSRYVASARLALQHQLLPWAALAALALGALFVGAGDRSPRLELAAVPSHGPVQPSSAAAAQGPAAAPSGTTRPGPQVLPATPKPNRPLKPSRVDNRNSAGLKARPTLSSAGLKARSTLSSRRHPTQQIAGAPRPLMWRLARALAGDGKFGVQPFPRAK